MGDINLMVMVHTSLAVLLEDLAKRDTRNDTDAARMAVAHRQEIDLLTTPWPTEEVPSGEATE